MDQQGFISSPFLNVAVSFPFFVAVMKNKPFCLFIPRVPLPNRQSWNESQSANQDPDDYCSNEQLIAGHATLVHYIFVIFVAVL